MEASNKVYAFEIKEAASKIPGIDNGNETWEWCYRENSTYLDCPIGSRSS
jgi:hypothetical protein